MSLLNAVIDVTSENIAVQLIACVFLFLLFDLFWTHFRTRKLPPGPIGLPLVGYIPFLPYDYTHKLKALFAKYGKIISLRIGSNDVVVISDYDIIRKLFMKDAMTYRPTAFNPLPATTSRNLVDWNGEEWKEQWSFSLKVFKQLGIGQREVEIRILDEIDQVVQSIKESKGMPLDTTCLLRSSASNIIDLLLFGERLDFDHPIRKLVDSVLKTGATQRKPSMLGYVLNIHWISFWLQHLPLTPINEFRSGVAKFEAYLKDRINRCKETFEPRKGNATCFTEAYLQAMHEQQKEGKFFVDEHMFGCVFAFFAAGSSTTSDMIKWFFLCMMAHPEVQEQLREEVDRMVGEHREITSDLRTRMPFTEAVIQEVYRVASLVPMCLVHSPATDCQIDKYLIPKQTHVYMAAFAVHQDPEYFAYPEKFDPSRFISSEGAFVRDDRVMTFGAGKRKCTGEPIAHMQVFLYVVSFIKHFIIKSPDGRKYTTEGTIEWFTRIPNDLPVVAKFEARK